MALASAPVMLLASITDPPGRLSRGWWRVDEPLPMAVIALFVVTVAFAFALDTVKVGVLQRLRID